MGKNLFKVSKIRAERRSGERYCANFNHITAPYKAMRSPYIREYAVPYTVGFDAVYPSRQKPCSKSEK